MVWHLATESFDGGTTAGLYSQLAGVLAGIAFAALLLYVTRTGGEVRDAGDQAVAANLTAAVAALILCAASYAVLAGAPKSAGSAALAAIVYGLPFGMAVLLLFYALALIFRQRLGLQIIGRISVYVVAAGGPIWVFCYLTMAAMTALSLRCGTGCGPRPVVVGLVLAVGLVVGSWLAIRVRRRGPTILRPELRLLLPAVLVLLATFATGVGSLVFPLLGAGYQPSDALLTLLLSVDFVVLLSFSRNTANALRDIRQLPAAERSEADDRDQAAVGGR